MSNYFRSIFCLLLLALVSSCHRQEVAESVSGSPPRVAVVVNPATTTPQLPLLAAVKDGRLTEIAEISYQPWHTATELQSLLLSEQGDLWIGHLDGLARARRAGAPVKLLLVTGWRKWAIVTRDDSLTTERLRQGREPLRLPCAPSGNPGQLWLEHLLAERPGKLICEGMEAQPLIMRLLSGREQWALLAEPMVTVLLQKDQKLKVAVMLEDLLVDGAPGASQPGRLPWAGIACHERLLQQHPDFAEQFIASMIESASALSAMSPAAIADYWPDNLAKEIPRDLLASSLERDLLLALPAVEAESAIKSLLAVIAPDLVYDPNLLYR